MSSHKTKKKHHAATDYPSSLAVSSYRPPPVLAPHLGSITELLPHADVVPGARKREVFLAYVPTAGRIPSKDVLFFQTKYLGFDTDGSRASWSKTKADLDHRDDVSLRHGTDANVTPYFVLPKYPNTDSNWVGKDHGIHVGAVGVIIGVGAGGDARVVCAQFADAGPYNELGEASMATHRAFGFERLKGSDGKPLARVKNADLETGTDFITIVFPDTGAFKPLSAHDIEVIARPLFTKLGGLL